MCKTLRKYKKRKKNQERMHTFYSNTHVQVSFHKLSPLSKVASLEEEPKDKKTERRKPTLIIKTLPTNYITQINQTKNNNK
jgi:hypothetical protein